MTVQLPEPSPYVEVEHEVSSDVHAVRLETSGNLTVQIGETPGLTISAPESVQSSLDVTERDGTLVPSSRGPGFWLGRVDYVLTVPRFDALEVDGSGDVTATGVDAETVSVSIDGSGEVDIRGAADRGSLIVGGSGDVDASELVLRSGVVELSGSGDIATHATDELTARLSGSGDIRVSGAPRITRTAEGSGEIVEVR